MRQTPAKERDRTIALSSVAGVNDDMGGVKVGRRQLTGKRTRPVPARPAFTPVMLGQLQPRWRCRRRGMERWTRWTDVFGGLYIFRSSGNNIAFNFMPILNLISTALYIVSITQSAKTAKLT